MAVGKKEYLNGIKGKIDYKRMRKVTWDDYKRGAIPLEKWCVLYQTPEGKEAIVCTWWQRVDKESGVIWLFLKWPPRKYQNPPKSPERIGFGGPGAWVDTIPDKVAQDSLDALSAFYVGKSWLERHWKPVVGGTIGAILLSVVIKKAR